MKFEGGSHLTVLHEAKTLNKYKQHLFILAQNLDLKLRETKPLQWQPQRTVYHEIFNFNMQYCAIYR